MTPRARFLFLVLLSILLTPGPAAAAGRIFTLWPAIDYRHSPSADYTSVHLLGPLIKYERKGEEREAAVRPFFFQASDPGDGNSYREVLYPVGTGKTVPGRTSWQALQLLQYDFGERELGSDNEFMLFPFLFYGETEERGKYFALFPVGGRIYDKFGRDEIRFTLFPLYGRTKKDETTITNILWPVFATVRGEEESGLKVWPLFGFSEKAGVYRKRFVLWPFFFRDDLDLDTETPRHRRAVLPFYLSQEAPDRSSRTVFWPFFHYRHDRTKGVEEWDAPWPLVRITRGGGRDGLRLLPLFADERTDAYRKRWIVWPVYKIEELHSDLVDRRRDRVLFFLFSRIEETKRESLPARKEKIDFWPLFSYQQTDGVGRFRTLSPLEPFFPQNEAVERNWSPLFWLYQTKWDSRGNAVSSFLWNLYWKERRGPDLAMELFPLIAYRREAAAGTDLSLLKGLLRYSSGVDGRRVRLFFLPWGIRWGAPDVDSPAEEG